MAALSRYTVYHHGLYINKMMTLKLKYHKPTFFITASKQWPLWLHKSCQWSVNSLLMMTYSPSHWFEVLLNANYWLWILLNLLTYQNTLTSRHPAHRGLSEGFAKKVNFQKTNFLLVLSGRAAWTQKISRVQLPLSSTSLRCPFLTVFIRCTFLASCSAIALVVSVRFCEADGGAGMLYSFAFINIWADVGWLTLETTALLFLAFMHSSLLHFAVSFQAAE